MLEEIPAATADTQTPMNHTQDQPTLLSTALSDVRRLSE